ncbi:MAG: flagellar filament capping protein FliD [Spirochaetaceae bacterium]|jgi:flagellar hook-associated protein 2|nr:flagellar filament capping protein FliD [Spirochaetaceae bacterium]
MPDIFVPGVKSRFDTDKMISGLMELERVPRNRVEKEIETLKTQKENWQTLGRRITELRESARTLYSFQNPFSERTAFSTDESVLGAEVTRESLDQNHTFTVKQLAAGDKFVSNPLQSDYKVPAGTYTFSTGKNDVSFKFNGGSIQEFTDTLNRRGESKISAQLIAVKPNTKSFIIESLDTGAENRLTFSDAAEKFAINTGILASQSAGPKLVNIPAVAAGSQIENLSLTAVQKTTAGSGLTVPAMASTTIALKDGVAPTETMLLRFETSVSANEEAVAADKAYAEKLSVYNAGKAAWEAAKLEAPDSEAADGVESASEGAGAEGVSAVPPAGEPDGMEAGLAEGGGAGDAEQMKPAVNEAFPPMEPPPPNVQNMNILTLNFSDGTSAALNPVKDSNSWNMQSYQLDKIAEGRTAVSITINNINTHRDFSIKDIQLFDPVGEVKTEPRSPISTAQDAIIVMDGIEIERPTNKIDDLVAGMTINVRSVSDSPVLIDVQTDKESVKDAVITLVGGYNRLMVELNVLTRNDESIIRELTYMNSEEQNELRKRLGGFAGDSSLLRFRTNLQEIMTSPYNSSSGETLFLGDFGINTDVRRSGGYDPSKMRGYLEIDEKLLDESINSNIGNLRQIFGLDTDGDKIIDSGIGRAIDSAVRPYVELGGVIAARTGSIDSKIAASERRIETIDKQLEKKEASLRSQYGQMESAYDRMEKLSNSLDQFGKQGGK